MHNISHTDPPHACVLYRCEHRKVTKLSTVVDRKLNGTHIVHIFEYIAHVNAERNVMKLCVIPGDPAAPANVWANIKQDREGNTAAGLSDLLAVYIGQLIFKYGAMMHDVFPTKYGKY